MHLKCRKHDSRVMVLKNKTIHRSDGSECDSPRVVINGNAYTPESIREFVHQKPTPGESFFTRST